MELKKYYLSDNPNPAPMADGIPLMESVNDILKVENSLIYCDSINLISIIRKFDINGLIHLGCRNIDTGMMVSIHALRFSSNYLICSKGFWDFKYKDFKEFQPKPQIQLCETHYIRITDYSDEVVTQIFKDNMKTLDTSPILGIDFETNDFPENVGHFPLGLSIVDKINGYYYDFNMDETFSTMKTYPKFFDALLDYVKTNAYRLYAFNVSFEIRCFYNMYHVFIKLQDTRAWCIVDGMKRNLKYGAQYYLESGSWDDDVDIEHGLLMQSFSIPKDVFESEYKLNGSSKFEVVNKLYELNKDNPDFLPRYMRFYGKVWAIGNQKSCGKYCCYDSLMDILIYEEIRKIKLVDHYYSEDCYRVYLYNQYLSATLELSGIYVNYDLLDELNSTCERVKFNTNLFINVNMMKYKIDFMEKQNNGIKFKTQLPEKLKWIVENKGSYFFITNNRVQLGKDFMNLFRKDPEGYGKVIEKYYDQLLPTITLYNDDEQFNKVKRGRKLFQYVGDRLYEEWNLPELWEQYQTEYIQSSDCNNKALKYWSGTEDELKSIMLSSTPLAWGATTPKEFWSEVGKYIADPKILKIEGLIKQSLDIIKFKAIYEKMKPALKGRTIYSDIDPSIAWVGNLFNMSSPDNKKLAAALVESYYKYDNTIYLGFLDLCLNKLKKPELFTKENLMTYWKQMKEKYPDYHQFEELAEYRELIMIPREKMIYESWTDRSTGQLRGKWKSTGEYEYVPRAWSLTFAKDTALPFPLRMAGAKVHTVEWNHDDPYALDTEYDVPTFEMCKFTGFYRLLNIINKVQSTSVTAIYRDSRRTGKLDKSHAFRYPGIVDADHLSKFYVKASANITFTGRWTSNVHSVLPSTEDTRTVIEPRIGDHFILPRDDNKEYKNESEVFYIDGMKFRYSDSVKLKDGSVKEVNQLIESDEFNPDWIKEIQENDKKSNVHWDFINKFNEYDNLVGVTENGKSC